MKLLLAALLPVSLAGAALAEAPAGKASTRLDIEVTTRGFRPAQLEVPANKPVTLVFTRKTEQTCAKSVVVKLGDGKQIERELPLDKPVEISVTFPRAGTVGYACSMDMLKGVIVVQ